MLCRLQRRVQIIAMTLESKVNVDYIFFSFLMEGVNIQHNNRFRCVNDNCQRSMITAMTLESKIKVKYS